MIRRATTSDIPCEATDETLIRIIGLKQAYGCNAPFVQFYTDEQDGYLSVMDGVGLLSTTELTDEWRVFLSMNTEIHTVHCSGRIGRSLLADGGWQGRVGDVMRYELSDVSDTDLSDVSTSPYLPAVHALLDAYFPNMASLNYWYPDASHRMRHGYCHIGCIIQDDRVLSTAMTVAECDTAVILGQVATHRDFRKQGMAGRCIKSVISQCKGKRLYILPLNETAAHLYETLGFIPCDEWAELHKIN